MKANEFVKLRGISYCKELLIKADGCVAIQAREDNARVSIDELKRLVESHELVESKGGITKAKEILADNPVWCFGSKRYSSPLERAIFDVESCQ